jgi:hypothetical protein
MKNEAYVICIQWKGVACQSPALYPRKQSGSNFVMRRERLHTCASVRCFFSFSDSFVMNKQCAKKFEFRESPRNFSLPVPKMQVSLMGVKSTLPCVRRIRPRIQSSLQRIWTRDHRKDEWAHPNRWLASFERLCWWFVLYRNHMAAEHSTHLSQVVG